MHSLRLVKRSDLPQWLSLAKEVEPLFGPMLDDPGFITALEQSIMTESAIGAFVTEATGNSLAGAVVVAREAGEIAWLAVASRYRGLGLGTDLLEAALRTLDPGREARVTTFQRSVAAGKAARALYESAGFVDNKPAGLNPAGLPIVIMIRPTSEPVSSQAALEGNLA